MQRQSLCFHLHFSTTENMKPLSERPQTSFFWRPDSANATKLKGFEEETEKKKKTDNLSWCRDESHPA